MHTRQTPVKVEPHSGYSYWVSDARGVLCRGHIALPEGHPWHFTTLKDLNVGLSLRYSRHFKAEIVGVVDCALELEVQYTGEEGKQKAYNSNYEPLTTQECVLIAWQAREAELIAGNRYEELFRYWKKHIADALGVPPESDISELVYRAYECRAEFEAHETSM